MRRRSVTLKGSVSKRWRNRHGGWRRNDGKVGCMNQGDLSGIRTVFIPPHGGRRADRAGVRAAVVARKRGNARGAKGRRKVDV